MVRTVKLTRKDHVSGFTHVGPRGPSFDCEAAETPTETLICGEGLLAGLDAQMAELFDLLVSKLDDSESERVRSEQRKFLKTRDRGCQHTVRQPSPDCLTVLYEERIEALRLQAWERRCEMFDADRCSESLLLPR